MASHVLVQDPGAISTRFSNENKLGYDADSIHDFDEIIDTQLAPEAEEELNIDTGYDHVALDKYLDRIPPREADLIRLYHHDKMKQEQIAKLFHITQAAVSYRLHRGIRRIQFLRTIPVLEHELFELELGPKFSSQDLEILWRMYETTCQSEIAKQMNLTQGRVRHRFFRSLQKIKDMIAEEAKELQIIIQMLLKQEKPGDEVTKAMQNYENAISNSKYAKYYTVYFAISDKHFNILHEVSLPQFRDRSDSQILPIE